MNKKLRTGSLGLLLSVGLALTACGGQPTPTGGEVSQSETAPVELEFVTWQMEEAGISDWWKAIIAEFESTHPGVTVTPRHVATSDIAQTLTNSFAADDPPQIIQLPIENVAQFVSEGFLEPLDDRLAGTDILQSWPQAQSLLEWDGKTQGVMIFGYPVQLFYNKAMLDAAGIAVPTSPDELLTAAQALTSGDVYGFGTVTTQHRDLFRQSSSHVVGFGGTWAANGEFKFDDPKVIAALEHFRAAAKFSPQGVDSAQKRELFLQGKVAMILDGPFLIPTFGGAAEGVDIQVARAPFEYVSYYPANSIHIPATISDREKDLVWEFIELMASPGMQDKMVELYQSTAPRAGAGASVETSPLLDQFLTDAPASVSIIPDSNGVRANFGVFDRRLQDGLMTMLTGDRPVAEIFAEVEQSVVADGIQP